MINKKKNKNKIVKTLAAGVVLPVMLIGGIAPVAMAVEQQNTSVDAFGQEATTEVNLGTYFAYGYDEQGAYVEFQIDGSENSGSMYWVVPRTATGETLPTEWHTPDEQVSKNVYRSNLSDAVTEEYIYLDVYGGPNSDYAGTLTMNEIPVYPEAILFNHYDVEVEMKEFQEDSHIVTFKFVEPARTGSTPIIGYNLPIFVQKSVTYVDENYEFASTGTEENREVFAPIEDFVHTGEFDEFGQEYLSYTIDLGEELHEHTFPFTMTNGYYSIGLNPVNELAEQNSYGTWGAQTHAPRTEVIEVDEVTASSNDHGVINVEFKKPYSYAHHGFAHNESSYLVELLDSNGNVVDSKEVPIDWDHAYWNERNDGPVAPYEVTFENVPRGDYTVSVKSAAQYEEVKYSDAVTYDITPVNLAPSEVIDVETIVNEDNTGKVTWTAPEENEVDEYEIVITDKDGNEIGRWTEDGVSTESDIPFDLDYDTEYVVTVTPKNEYGEGEAGSDEFQTHPEAIMPGDTTDVEAVINEDNTGTINWANTDSENVDEYEIVITDNEGNEIGRWTESGDKTSSDIPFELDYDTNYVVTVTPKNENGDGASGSDEFQTYPEAPVAPALPGDVTDVETILDEDNNGTVTWEGDNENTDEYEIVITDKDGNEIGRWTEDGDKNESEIPFELDPDTEYIVTVTPKNENGSGESATGEFTTNPANDGDDNNVGAGNGDDNNTSDAGNTVTDDNGSLSTTGSESNNFLAVALAALMAGLAFLIAPIRRKFAHKE